MVSITYTCKHHSIQKHLLVNGDPSRMKDGAFRATQKLEIASEDKTGFCFPEFSKSEIGRWRRNNRKTNTHYTPTKEGKTPYFCLLLSIT